MFTSNITKYLDRNEFLSTADVIFDKMMKKNFPEFSKEFGIDIFNSSAYPKVDIIESQDELIIEAEIPGVKKENISVKVDDNNVLMISGEKRDLFNQKKSNEPTRVIIKELKKSSFKRTFLLDPLIYDRKTIEAKFNDGVLLVTIKKVQKSVNKTTEIKID